MTTLDILQQARDMIATRGWASKASGSPDNSKPYCVGLALTDAARVVPFDGAIPWTKRRQDAFEVFCRANDIRFKVVEGDGFIHDVYEWNDFECDGEKNALAALDKAIALLLPSPDVSFLDEIEEQIGDVDDADRLVTVS